MPRRKTNPLEFLDPRNYLEGDEEEVGEDETPMSKESLEVYKFLFRMMEQWKFLPVEGRDGGLLKGQYLGQIDDSAQVALEVMRLLHSFFVAKRPFDRKAVDHLERAMKHD